MKTCLHLLPCIAAGLSLLIPAKASAAKDACSLMTSADAQAVLGEEVGPPQQDDRASSGVEGSACKFRSSQSRGLRAKTLTLTVRYSATDLSGSAAGMKESLVSGGFKNVREIPGVGNAALWATNTVMGKAMAELTVRKGKNVMLTIVIMGVADEATALEHAKELAAKVLPKT